MVLALPHVRRPPKYLPRPPPAGSISSSGDGHDDMSNHGHSSTRKHQCRRMQQRSARSAVGAVIGGITIVLLVLLATVGQGGRGGGSVDTTSRGTVKNKVLVDNSSGSTAVILSSSIEPHTSTQTADSASDDPTKPPLGSAPFIADGIGSLCTKSSRCMLLYPAAEISDIVPDEAVDRTVRIRLGRSTTIRAGNGNGGDAEESSLRYRYSPRTGKSALLTRRGAGIGHDINQDRAFILQAPGDEIKVVGIFDGHGDLGHVTSHYVSSHLPAMLARTVGNKAKDDEVALKQLLTDAFLQVDSEVDASGASLGDMSMSGSTAIVALRRSNRLYIASTGDSLAFVVSRDRPTGNTSIVYKTGKHKPDLPEERARVEGAGGKVYEPPAWLVGDSPRVLSPISPEDEVAGALPFGLAMSRSIGDRELKGLGVIADPTVHVVDIDSLTSKGDVDLFIIAATDGLYDHVSPEELANRIGKATYDEPTARQLLSTMEGLIMQASQVWLDIMRGQVYRDDITIAVAEL